MGEGAGRVRNGKDRGEAERMLDSYMAALTNFHESQNRLLHSWTRMHETAIYATSKSILWTAFTGSNRHSFPQRGLSDLVIRSGVG